MSKEVDHSDRAHAEFGPSSLKYVKQCAGFQSKGGTNAAAEKGTRIHEALEIRDPSALQDDEEVQIYDRLLREEIETIDGLFGGHEGVDIIREERLVLELDCESPTFGTADIVARKGSMGLGLDYKTGFSKIDDVEDNMQAKAYTLGIFQRYPEIEEVTFVFLVPVRDEILVGRFTRDQVDDLRNEISDIIRKAEQTRPKWETGGIDLDDLGPSVHCRFCQYEDQCPAMGYLSMEVVKRYQPHMIPEGTAHSSEIDDPAVLEKWLVIAKTVEGWASAIKHKATTMALENPDVFESFKLRSMGALKKTTDKNSLAQLAMKHGLGLDEVIEAADLSLNKLSKVIHAKAAKGEKAPAVREFEDQAMELDLVEVGDTRYTLAKK